MSVNIEKKLTLIDFFMIYKKAIKRHPLLFFVCFTSLIFIVFILSYKAGSNSGNAVVKLIKSCNDIKNNVG